MGRIVHFEIHYDDAQRAMKFYEAVFGWEFQKWEGPFEYWLIMTGPEDQPGIDGGLTQRVKPVTGDDVIAYVCTVDVDDIDAAIVSALANGGSIALEKNAVPGVGWLVYFKDTEGNIVGAMQSDPQAGM